ncbi:MAG: ATP-binding protein [Armatimonadota bacterium]|nr:ATP-binding protein [bacterium]
MEAQLSKSLEIRIPADTRYVAVVRRGVRSLAESVGFTGEDLTDMEVAVSEAVTNSVTHGSPNTDAAVLVKCQASGERVVVEVEDQGAAEDLPLEPIHDRIEEHGRGVLMMRTLMDELEGSRTNSGMKVRMAKQKGQR